MNEKRDDKKFRKFFSGFVRNKFQKNSLKIKESGLHLLECLGVLHSRPSTP